MDAETANAANSINAAKFACPASSVNFASSANSASPVNYTISTCPASSVNSTLSTYPASSANTALLTNSAFSTASENKSQQYLRKLYVLEHYNKEMGGSDNHARLNSYYSVSRHYHRRN